MMSPGETRMVEFPVGAPVVPRPLSHDGRWLSAYHTSENLKRRPLGETPPFSYTAGYSPIPSDLEHSCLWLVFWYAKIRDAADIGRSTKNKEGESISYLQSAPDDVKNCILRYKRTECLAGNASIYNG